MKFMRKEKINDLSLYNYNIKQIANIISNEIYELTKESNYMVDIYYYNTLLINNNEIEKLYNSKRVNSIEINRTYNIKNIIENIQEKHELMKMTNMFNVVPSIIIIDKKDNINKQEFDDIIKKLRIHVEFVNMFIYIF